MNYLKDKIAKLESNIQKNEEFYNVLKKINGFIIGREITHYSNPKSLIKDQITDDEYILIVNSIISYNKKINNSWSLYAWKIDNYEHYISIKNKLLNLLQDGYIRVLLNKMHDLAMCNYYDTSADNHRKYNTELKVFLNDDELYDIFSKMSSRIHDLMYKGYNKRIRMIQKLRMLNSLI